MNKDCHENLICIQRRNYSILLTYSNMLTSILRGFTVHLKYTEMPAEGVKGITSGQPEVAVVHSERILVLHSALLGEFLPANLQCLDYR